MRKRVPALLILAANSRSCTWTSLTRRRQEKGLHTEDRHNAEESITVNEHISGTLWKGAVRQPEYHYPVKEKIGGASPLHPPPEGVNKTDVRGETGREKTDQASRTRFQAPEDRRKLCDQRIESPD
ncbi:hypothetical protein AVEN_259349-1 [Araneus ventricosus]|uniref:Uncharacterized protein n=1 Tax=Araneus ventricosus TaxID=182803 RepID=A0A4Y2DRR6_ARAVE|nr:hypothetical protein AVEN_259349-1 [Araneus ventricosus]